ncbi:MAG: hypothetical protein ABGX44_00905 [Candidatus Poseidoniia archaeon]|jgi:hypothetical protein|nr:MAG: hypothetical protein CXT68_00690 [Euryarchaeota archaeon]HIG19768.1 hypothetical protein [Candidatus Poseidoniales archaeon]
MSNQKGDKKDGDFEYNQRTAKGVLKDHDLSSEEALVGEAKNYDDNDDQFLNRKELTAAAEAIVSGETRSDESDAGEDDVAEYAPQEDDSDVPCSECGEMIAPTSSICPECKHSFN